MKAWVVEDFNKPYVLQSHKIPELGNPHDMLIRVDAASYCHTDAVIAAGIVSPPKLPHVGGHEYAGTVTKLLHGQHDCHGHKVGDRVAIRGMGNHVCGQCKECQNDSSTMPDDPGFSVFCPLAGIGLGIDRPGGFREFAVVDGRQAARIPEGLNAVDVAPLMCAGLTIFTALVKCNLEPGQRVGIMGCGGLGHLGLQFATSMELRTMGLDVSPRALDLARGLGTSAQIIDSSKEPARHLRAKMGEEDSLTVHNETGLDAMLILTDSQDAFDYGMSLVRDGGQVILLSFPPDGFRVQATDIVFRRIRLEGSLIGSNKAMAAMLDFAVKHNVRAKVTSYPFEKLNKLVEDYRSGTPGKLVLDMARKDIIVV